MAVFVELVTEPFDTIFNQTTAGAKTTRRAGTDFARRPLRGVEVKDDTYAIIKVIRADGSEIPVMDSSSSSGQGTSYTNFILQSVTEQRMEKHQIVDTFGEAYIFFFGEAPRMLMVTATLINSHDFNWKAEFLDNYENFFRGTRLVELGARTYLFYDDNIVEGYMVNCSTAENANNPMLVQMQFQFFVTHYQNISLIGDPNFPIRGSVPLPEGLDLRNENAYDKLLNLQDAAARNEFYRELGQTYSKINDKTGVVGQKQLSDVLRRGITSTGFPGDDVERYTHGRYNSSEAYGLTRSLPLRSLIADNVDEYTAMQPVEDLSTDEQKAAAALQETKDLAAAGAAWMQTHGVRPDAAQDHKTAQELGIGPTFVPGGRGIGFGSGSSGTYATFGPVPAAGFAGSRAGAGAFAGVGVGAGFSGFASAYAGVGASALIGGSAGDPRLFGNPYYTGTPFAGSPGYVSPATRLGFGFGTGVGVSFGTGYPTANPFGGGPWAGAPLASVSDSAYARAISNPSGFPSTQARAAALAGGYPAGGYSVGFGFSASGGGNQNQSFAGFGGTGASTSVGGRPSAFGMTSVPGQLTNTNLSGVGAFGVMDTKYYGFFF
jgi:hypothetical protein